MRGNILLTEKKKNVYCLVFEETEIFGKKWVKISGLLLPKLASSLPVVLQVRRGHWATAWRSQGREEPFRKKENKLENVIFQFCATEKDTYI